MDDIKKTRTLLLAGLEIPPDAALLLVDRLEAAEKDAERYRWCAENAVIETETWRHDGRDPASTKHTLDNAIDAAIAASKGAKG